MRMTTFVPLAGAGQVAGPEPESEPQEASAMQIAMTKRCLGGKSGMADSAPWFVGGQYASVIVLRLCQRQSYRRR